MQLRGLWKSLERRWRRFQVQSRSCAGFLPRSSRGYFYTEFFLGFEVFAEVCYGYADHFSCFGVASHHYVGVDFFRDCFPWLAEADVDCVCFSVVAHHYFVFFQRTLPLLTLSVKYAVIIKPS